jgi:Co/Zn/Cd efflux system component
LHARNLAQNGAQQRFQTIDNAAESQLPGVTAIHDLHVWAMSTTETALTCHLVVPNGHPGDEFLRDA